jgi:hypothetical protein
MRFAVSGTSSAAWPLWVLLFLASALGATTCSASAHAQDALPSVDLAQPCAPHVPEAARRELLTRGAAAGIWFHGDVARCMLDRLALLPLYVERVRLLDERLAVQEHIEDTLTRAELLSRQIADQATAALDEAERGRRQAEEELGAWYRSPVLWTGVGGVIVAAIAVAIRYAIDPW